ncbi:MAG TPA: heme-binding domain-containing protein [Polyangiales bacterium]
MQADRARSVKRGLMVAAGLFVAAQLVPYGRDHTNPPVGKTPEWDSDATRQLAERACFDCHSNQTHWPWYSNVAPVSWLVTRDVNKGRSAVNFTELQYKQRRTKDASDQVRDGEMPLWFYAILHPKAQLTAAERKALADGLEHTFE